MGIPTIQKVPGESRLFWFQCAARLASGETVTAVNSITITPVSEDTPLTSSGVTVSGTTIQFRLTGGEKNTRYTVEISYNTSLSNIRIGSGYVQVDEEDE